MKKILLPLLLVLFLGTSCSSRKKDADATTASQTIESTSNDFVVDSDEEDLFLEDEKKVDEAPQEQEVTLEDQDTPSVAAEETVVDVGQCQNGTYAVKDGETLMQIAFSLYGDYRKWKEIASMNPNINISNLGAGTTLSYCGGHELSWQPQGNPHVIRTGETLGIISKDKYGTIRRWKDIYDNNKPLIHDPNIIFAGFTIYYIPDDVADL